MGNAQHRSKRNGRGPTRSFAAPEVLGAPLAEAADEGLPVRVPQRLEPLVQPLGQRHHVVLHALHAPEPLRETKTGCSAVLPC